MDCVRDISLWENRREIPYWTQPNKPIVQTISMVAVFNRSYNENK